MKNIILVFIIGMILVYIFTNTYENREDIVSYMDNKYVYNSGDILFLASNDDQDIVVVTDSTTEKVKAVRPLENEYETMMNYPNHIIEVKNEETTMCYNFSYEKSEEVSCEVIADQKPIHTEKLEYSNSFEEFLNIHSVSTKDYIILE